MGTKIHEPHRFIEEALRNGGEKCLFWPFSRARNGYPRIYFQDGARWKSRLVHNLICELVHGPAPTSKHGTAHSCGNGHMGCINPMHLRWATQKENEADKVRHGTRARGSRCGKAVLNEKDVKEIRSLTKSVKRRELAKRFKVSTWTIRAVQKRRTWGWL